MHKYDEIRRLDARTVVNEGEQAKKKSTTPKKAWRVIVRFLAALGLVLALFVGKFFGSERIAKATDKLKEAICYDYFTEERADEDKA